MKKFRFSAQYCTTTFTTVVATGDGVRDDVVDNNVALVLGALLQHLDERLDLIAALLRHGSLHYSTVGVVFRIQGALSWMASELRHGEAGVATRRRPLAGYFRAGWFLPLGLSQMECATRQQAAASQQTDLAGKD
ncbi:hypothetical protein ON010_g6035 [Phytophthora cinnamomi]|nr:hypothetical protein ON010_g6035 [Phytophthora cinnamomi]